MTATIAIALAPRAASACHDATICVEFEVYATDLGVGDYPDHQDGSALLRLPGVRVLYLPPPPEAPVEFLTDSDGCFEISTEWVEGHKLLVYPEAFLDEDPLGNEPNIHITGHESLSETETGTIAPPWLANLHSVGDGDLVVATLPPDPLSETFAWVVWIVRQAEDRVSNGLTGDHIMRVTPFGGGSSAYGRLDVLYMGGGTEERFRIAHEVGHWYQQNLIEDFMGGTYGYCAEDDPCLWDDLGDCAQGGLASTTHALRSVELGRTAAFEGFAHFFASWVFDDLQAQGAYFKYYKEILPAHESEYSDLSDGEYLVSLVGGDCVNNACPAGGHDAWVEEECPNDWDNDQGFNNAKLEVSSELDWMRMFWQFSSDEIVVQGNAPPFADFIEFVRQASNLPVSLSGVPDYEDYHEIITDPNNTYIDDYADRFEDLAVDNGIDNGGI